MLQAGSIGLLGLGLNHVTALREAAAGSSAERPTRHRSAIFIFLSGGLTQHDSFDPKPDAPVGIRGEFAPIATRTSGMHVCEHLPLLAARSDKWSLVRSLTTPHNEHSQGHFSILTGRTPMPPGFSAVAPMPGDWPSIAAVAGDVLPRRSNNLPPAIVLPERLIHRTGRTIPGQFGGQMGPNRDPWFVEASPFNGNTYGAYPDYEFHFVTGRHHTESLKFQAPNLSLPQGLSMSRLTDRGTLLGIIDRQRADLERTAQAESFDNHRQAAISLLTEARMQRAFDIHNADPRDQDRYGRNAFGWSLLMARQLVEMGTGLVQVNLGNNETWDTHENNFPLLRDCLLPPTDRALSALIDDLHERGRLEDTLIVMCGEMGRTPKVNAGTGESKTPGRDHWGAVQSVFVAGGCVPGGVVVGASDKDGAYPSKSPQTPENLAATIYHSLGIPETAAWKDDAGRPFHVYHGEPIAFG
ncbi:MAG: DUF1501 domain-containing protein [Planctomycetaceae bacterium]|nr:DUF1501 domain-containing protein [Planctomycetaceae bacterium]